MLYSNSNPEDHSTFIFTGRDHMKFLTFLEGLVCGALVGAITGLLLAPQPGDEFQSKVRERYDEVMDEGRRAAAERRAELEAQFAEAKRAPRPA
jgi:YtxH-like protein